VTWQVNYALENLNAGGQLAAIHLQGDTIRVIAPGQRDVVAIISADEEIDECQARRYHDQEPNLDFLCGYRKACIWHGGAIEYLRNNQIGWGTLGTLSSAALEGKVNTASHKEYFFSDRLIRQFGIVAAVNREFDRIYTIFLRSGRKIRFGMILDYEPTADSVRSLWDKFGHLDIIWNINPNGDATKAAINAAQELGCKVVKWDGMKEFLRDG